MPPLYTNAPFRPSGAVEVMDGFKPCPKISHVVLDFDGTVSWIRHGWPSIMREVFEERLPRLDGETEEAVIDLLQSIILGMNGRPTILQMMRFAEIVVERGGPALDPETLREEYQSRLDREIAARANMIRSGIASHDDFIVFKARPFLEFLVERGLTPIILSSTIQERVREEAEILNLTQIFGGRINGGTGDPTQFSKLAVFRRILAEENIDGSRLLSIGDGPVEISSAITLGGTAIGVCSDEDHNGSGVMDPFKYQQLKAAGAHVLVPDFRDLIALMDQLLGS